MTPDGERVVPLGVALDLGRTLRQVGKWSGRLAHHITPSEAWRAQRTPQGPSTLHLRVQAPGVHAVAWGPGAQWSLEHLTDLLGLSDNPDQFRPEHPMVRRLWRERGGWRYGASRLVLEQLLPAILHQRVTTRSATRSWLDLMRRYGEPAPGPVELLITPDPQRLAGLRYEDLHPLGVERGRAETFLRACGRAKRLQEAAFMPSLQAYERLTALRGIGPWTASNVLMRAHGDADAVIVGDYHIPNHVSWLLAGEPRADDARMLQLLEPFAGHRGRVVMLAKGHRAPRFGPKNEVIDVRNR